jgi:putative FmdB family regulatory protein
MPIYEYECTKCGRIEEVLQKFSDKAVAKCKYCSGKLHKLISHSSFHLKGTGWYVTDYANKSKANSSVSKKKDNTQTADTSTSSSSKTNSKKSSDNSAP